MCVALTVTAVLEAAREGPAARGDPPGTGGLAGRIYPVDADPQLRRARAADYDAIAGNATRVPASGCRRYTHGMDNAGTAGGARRAAKWRFMVSPPWLAWHAFAVVAFWGMFWLGDWQLHRALAGNALSWAYTFEWPIFALMGAVFWGKTIRDEIRVRSGQARSAAAPDLPGGATGPDGTTMAGSTSGEIELYDPELAAYNAYLARLNRKAESRGR